MQWEPLSQEQTSESKDTNTRLTTPSPSTPIFLTHQDQTMVSDDTFNMTSDEFDTIMSDANNKRGADGDTSKPRANTKQKTTPTKTTARRGRSGRTV